MKMRKQKVNLENFRFEISNFKIPNLESEILKSKILFTETPPQYPTPFLGTYTEGVLFVN